MSDERVEGRVFGEVAQEFDRIRAGYPAELVDDVLAYTAAERIRAIEVGAGTGKATTAFAARGVQVTAVEPDDAMAALLADRLAGLPGVTIVSASFEDYTPAEPGTLLFCAQAWHWTDPGQRWRRAADALAPGGAIALFWNNDRIADPALRAAVGTALGRYASRIMPDEEHATSAAELAGYWPRTDLVTLAEFGDLDERLYLWERELSDTDYLAYLSTQSTFRMLPPQLREELFDAVAAHLPDRVTLAVETTLYLGRRSA